MRRPTAAAPSPSTKQARIKVKDMISLITFMLVLGWLTLIGRG